MCVLLAATGWAERLSCRWELRFCVYPSCPAQPRGFGSRIPPRPGDESGHGRRPGARTGDNGGISAPPACPGCARSERNPPDCRKARGHPKICPLSSAFRCALPASPPGTARTCSAKDREAGNSRRRISHRLGAHGAHGWQSDAAPQAPGAEPRAGDRWGIVSLGSVPSCQDAGKGPRGEPRAGCTLRSAAGLGSGSASVMPKGSCTI